jgi:hypothetical protein
MDGLDNHFTSNPRTPGHHLALAGFLASVVQSKDMDVSAQIVVWIVALTALDAAERQKSLPQMKKTREGFCVLSRVLEGPGCVGGVEDLSRSLNVLGTEEPFILR